MSCVAVQTAGRVGSLGVGSASSACRLVFRPCCWAGLWVGSRVAVLVCGELGRFAAERRGGSGRLGWCFRGAVCGFCVVVCVACFGVCCACSATVESRDELVMTSCTARDDFPPRLLRVVGSCGVR